MGPRLPRRVSRRPRVELDAVRLSAHRRDYRLLRQPGRRTAPRDVPGDGLRARNRADVLGGGSGSRHVGRIVRRRDAESVRAGGALDDAADARRVELWAVLSTAAAVDAPARWHRASRIRGRAADGPWNGS